MNPIYKKCLETITAMEEIKMYKKDDDEFGSDSDMKVEGIPFRFATVQYHIIDEAVEQLKKNKDVFGDVNIYSQKFTMPGFGEKNSDLREDEYQFEIYLGIKSKTDQSTYLEELRQSLQEVADKYDLDIAVYPMDDYGFDVNRVVFHTKKDGIFEKS
jgi:hypothetical protein